MEDRTEELRRQNRLILDAPYLSGVLDAMPNFAAVLNQQRKAVFINRALRDFLGNEANSALPEIRMGVVFSCRFAEKSKGGCGASEYCTMCGANLAIRTALKGEPCTRDCTVSVENDGIISSLDFSVTARPMEVGGVPFVIFTAVDIEGQKRRRTLGNVFFKDVLTLASGIRGIALSLNEQAPQAWTASPKPCFWLRTILWMK